MRLHPNGLAVASYRHQTINYRRFLLRKTALLAVVSGFFFLACFADAQQADAMFGFGTVMSPGASPCTVDATSGQVICPEKGGLYTNIGADVIFHRRIGFAFDAAWRASQGNYGGLGVPYRPIIFDFNGVYQPRLGKKVGLDLMGGIGWQSTRYYGFTPTFSCEQFNACYQSSNHFLVDIGAGLRYYVFGHAFVRPEVRYYKVFNNTVDFTSGNIVRVGASIGYTIGPD
jgi:Outer membrane protein beta-barrel domain